MTILERIINPEEVILDDEEIDHYVCCCVPNDQLGEIVISICQQTIGLYELGDNPPCKACLKVLRSGICPFSGEPCPRTLILF